MNLIKFFKKNYALQNMKKSKGILLIMLIVIPVITTFSLYTQDTNTYTRPYEIFVASGANFFGMIIIPFILSNVFLGYVYKRNSIDFINSMPISRKNLYLTNMLVGFVYIVILQLITFLMSSFYIISVGTSLFSVKFMFDIFLAMTIVYTFLFVTSSVALSVSGNRFTQIVVFLLLLFLIPFIRFVNLGAATSQSEKVFFVNSNGVAEEYHIEEENVFAMPLTTFIDMVSGDRVLTESSAILTMALTVLYTFIGLKLFEKRKMENTGNSFESEKIHLLVKGLTIYPAIVVLKEIFDELEIPQFALIIFIMFVYYFVYDLITSKKIKFKKTILSFVVTCGCLLLVTMGLTKVGELTHESKEYYYAEDIRSAELRLSEIFYGDVGYARIDDEKIRNMILDEIALDKNQDNYRYYDSLVSSYRIDKDWEYDRHSVALKCKFSNNKELVIYGNISKEAYKNVIDYVLNNEEYLKELADVYKVDSDTRLRLTEGAMRAVINVGEDKKLKESINSQLVDYVKEKIENYDTKMEYDYYYYQIIELDFYDYEDFDVKQYTLNLKYNDDIKRAIYNKINELAKDSVKERIDEIKDEEEEMQSYTHNPYLINGEVTKIGANGASVREARFNDTSLKDIYRYLTEDYKPYEVDYTKDYYQIDIYESDTTFYINDINEFLKAAKVTSYEEEDGYYEVDVPKGIYNTVNLDANSI